MSELNHDTCYEALKSHDPRFDGVFFVAVKTTGIYCRTVCPARTPLRKNCTFFKNAPQAEQAGFRPCLRCRPELAPGNGIMDAVPRLAALALNRIEDGALQDRSLDELAKDMGISARHFRRVIEKEYGVNPIQLAQTQRLLYAKRLLTDTSLPITEVAFASGFSSVRRFNALFKEKYELNPSALRKTISPYSRLVEQFNDDKPSAPSGRRTKREEGDLSEDDSKSKRGSTSGSSSGSASGSSSGSTSEPMPGSISGCMSEDTALVCKIAFIPPFPWSRILHYLEGRCHPFAEIVVANSQDRSYIRTLAIGKYAGWLAIENLDSESCLKLRVSESLAPVLPRVIARVKRLLDTFTDPQPIGESLKNLPDAWTGMRIVGAVNGFEMAIRAILGQQVAVKAATTISGRLTHRLGKAITTPWVALNRLTPEPEAYAFAKLDVLTACGITTARAESLQALAKECITGNLVLEPGTEVENAVEKLQTIKGIGPWTAQYIAMRALGWPDAFPHSDLGLKKKLGISSDKEMLRIAEQWRPWRAYAAMHLWSEEPSTSEEPSSPKPTTLKKVGKGREGE